MDLLSLALVVALAAWTARRARGWWQRRRDAAARATTPGLSADHPLVLSAPHVVDEAVAAARCRCGGRVKALGESSRLGLRVVRTRCVACEEDVDLYFTLPRLLH